MKTECYVIAKIREQDKPQFVFGTDTSYVKANGVCFTYSLDQALKLSTPEQLTRALFEVGKHLTPDSVESEYFRPYRVGVEYKLGAELR